MIRPTRADRLTLDLAAPPPPTTDGDLPLSQLDLHPDAVTTLTHRLYTPGSWSGGPLYGQVRLGVLHVRLALAAGPLGWRPVDPLGLNLDYLRGCSDVAMALSGETLDWAGHWLLAPDRQLPAEVEQLRWLEAAHGEGLLTPDHPLLLVGWRAGQLQAVAACAGLDGDWLRLPVEFRRRE